MFISVSRPSRPTSVSRVSIGEIQSSSFVGPARDQPPFSHKPLASDPPPHLQRLTNFRPDELTLTSNPGDRHGRLQLAHHQHRRPRPRIGLQFRPLHPHPHRPTHLHPRRSDPQRPNPTTTTRWKCRRGVERGAGECTVRCGRAGKGMHILPILWFAEEQVGRR